MRILLSILFAIGFVPNLFSQNNTEKKEVVKTLLKPTPTEERWAGNDKRQKLIENSILKNLQFRNVGPTSMSGRVTDIDANPDNPNEFFVAYASGGLWYTNNSGNTFKPLFDHEAVMTIGDIAVDWKTGTIYVGTGESNSSRSSYSGMGIYKSTNQGKTWENVGLKDTHHIGRIVIHPTNPNIVWVASIGHLYSPNAERGIFKTTDGGKTWKKTLYINDNTGAIDLAINPQNPDEVYSTMWRRDRKAWDFKESGAESGIYKSTDGGDTWKSITDAGSGFPQGDKKGRIGIAIYPKNPNIVYAIIDNNAIRPKTKKDNPEEKPALDKAKVKVITKEEFLALDNKTIEEYLENEGFPARYTADNIKQQLRENKIKVGDIYAYTHNGNDDLFDIQIEGAQVYRSNNAGNTWFKTHEMDLDGMYYTYGYYFGQIWVAPNNPDKVIIAGVPILKSLDGGKTFKSIDRFNVHADHHAIWFNPKDDKHFINGNDGGINYTLDGGNSYVKCNPIPVGQFYSVDYDLEKPYNVYGGLQDNGVYYGPSTNKFDPKKGLFENGDNFKLLVGGDGMQVRADWRDNATIYAGFQFGNYFRINRKTGERKYIETPRDLGEDMQRFNWEAPFQISRHIQDVLYFGSQKVYRSYDKGDTWHKISEDLTRGYKNTGNVPYSSLTSIEESPLKFGVIYTGSDDGMGYLTKDAGNTWTKIIDKPGFWISMVQPSTHKEARVYASMNGYREDHFLPYLMVSEDFGKTWAEFGKELPNEPVNVIREDPQNENLLYVGTDNGLYISFDRGKTFMSSNNKFLPNVAVHDVKIHHRDHELLVGTHGRSIYIANAKTLQNLTQENLQKSLIFDQPNTGLTHNRNWGRIFNKFADKEDEQYPIHFYSKDAGTATLKVKSPAGLVLKSITHQADKGLNYFNYDMSIDESQVDALKTEMKYSKSVKKADDGKYYWISGKYVLELNINGATEKREVEIKDAKKTKARDAVPQGESTPGEWRQWRRNYGIKKVV